MTSPTPETEPDDDLQEFLNTLGDLLTRLNPLHRLFDKYDVPVEECQLVLDEIRRLLNDVMDAWNGLCAVREQRRLHAIAEALRARARKIENEGDSGTDAPP
jgi:hypothetical protein